ncbi:hypothetical protein AAF712_012959 [Marasmius tenuissimus]|uniref:Transposase n=1 Tax=Marasmius tenuissimus TaxID=585030 RepID=A0ABR2ZH12_9AGAR
MPNHFPCYCIRCARSPIGYEYQTRQVINLHLKNYGDARKQENWPSLQPARISPQLDILENPVGLGTRRPLDDLDTNTGAEEESMNVQDDDWWNQDQETHDDLVMVLDDERDPIMDWWSSDDNVGNCQDGMKFILEIS